MPESESKSLKSFDSIHEDYAFFQAHTSESEVSRVALLRHLQSMNWTAPRKSVVDFGCGAGEFISSFLEALDAPPDALRLQLIDPDSKYLAEALSRVQKYSDMPIEATMKLLNREHSADVLISNHALYYVPDLTNALGEIVKTLSVGGQALLVLANRDNSLLRAWQSFFSLLGETVPFHNAETVEAKLIQLGLEVKSETLESELVFRDSQENRAHIIRFLLGQHLERLKCHEDALHDFFRPYSANGQVRMPLYDQLIAGRRTQ